MESTPSLFVLLGGPSVGKSKLANKIAKKFSGEVIYADSLKVYKGLEIITNKLPAEEQEVPHHLLDIVDPLEKFLDTDFRDRALAIINKLLESGKSPVIVGGTRKYIDSILWITPPSIQLDNKGKRRLSITEGGKDECDEEPGAKKIYTEEKPGTSIAERFIEEHRQSTEDTPSTSEPATSTANNKVTLRFKNVYILWLSCDMEILDKRQNERVDKLLEKGVLDELLAVHTHYNEERIRQCLAVNYTGIFQEIGFKQFHKYLVLPPITRLSTEGHHLKNLGIQTLKIIYKRNARLQQKWIQTKFLKESDFEVPPVYRFDASGNWNVIVLQVLNLIDKLVNKISLSFQDSEPILKEYEQSMRLGPGQYWCTDCERILHNRTEWEAHINSKKHSKKVKYNEAVKQKNKILEEII